MLRNAFLAASAAAYILLMRVTDALAAGSDPSKVGDKLFNIISPNVKSLWKLGVIVALLVIVLGRPKGSFIAATFAAIVISGAIIWNTGGFSHMVSAIGDKVM